jgi:hypothetical protein
MMRVVRRLLVTAMLAAGLCAPAMGHTQSCSLCRDSTAGAPAQEREGMRRGILVLGIPAGGVFVGILVLALRMKPKEEEQQEN